MPTASRAIKYRLLGWKNPYLVSRQNIQSVNIQRHSDKEDCTTVANITNNCVIQSSVHQNPGDIHHILKNS